MELRWFLPITIGELPVTTHNSRSAMILCFPKPDICDVLQTTHSRHSAMAHATQIALFSYAKPHLNTHIEKSATFRTRNHRSVVTFFVKRLPQP